MTEGDYRGSFMNALRGSRNARGYAAKTTQPKSRHFFPRINVMKFYAGVFGVLLLGLAISQTPGQKQQVAATSTTHVIAAGGFAYALNETATGVSKSVIKTQRKVMSAFGFAADKTTLLYTSLNNEGQPVPALFLENVTTGELRKLNDRIVFAARWSPRDSSVIAFTFADDSGTGVATLNTVSGLESVLSRENVLPDRLEWDATGHHVSFIRADEQSQLIFKQGVKRPVDEYPYTVLTPRSVAVDEPVLYYPKSNSVVPEDSSNKLPIMKRPVQIGDIPPASSLEDASVPSDLYAYSVRTESGAEFSGENLLGDGKIYAPTTPGGEVREIAHGQLIDTLNHGIVVREFNSQESVLKYIGVNGQAVTLATTAVTYHLPLASAVVTQGGGGYPAPGNCGLYDHTASSNSAYAYDFQNSTSGAHVLASAPGLVVYIRNDVTCNSCDTNGCSAYPAGGCPSSSSNSGWGNVVIIQHADGTFTKYTHLQANSVQVAVGNNVCEGRYLGRQGFTGCSVGNMEGCGSHLHFQRQSSSALSGTSQSITFAESPSGPLSCGTTYRSSLTETTTCATTGQARPVVSSSLRLSSGGPYYVGQTVGGYFTIVNRGTGPITFLRLLIGGRLNGDQSCAGGCPDFSSVSNVTLSPGQSYAYSSSRYLDRSGSYGFFVAYQKSDGSWMTSVPTENGAINALTISVQSSTPTLTGKSPTTIYASPYDQNVYFSGTRLTNTQYVYVQFPSGSGAYIYPPGQIFSRTSNQLGCKIKFGARGQYYVWAYTSDGGWSNALAMYVY